MALELAAAAEGDPMRTGKFIERLLRGAGLAIAIAAKGNSRTIGEMLMAAETYLHEAASGHARLGSFMATAQSTLVPAPDQEGE